MQMPSAMAETTTTPDPFGYDKQPNPHAFVQWKGTDVCMDFHCGCGAHCHFDGYFAYVVQCPHCKEKWQMPFHLYPRKYQPENDPGAPFVVAEPDEDMEIATDG